MFWIVVLVIGFILTLDLLGGWEASREFMNVG
jgi:hypothetical protein